MNSRVFIGDQPGISYHLFENAQNPHNFQNSLKGIQAESILNTGQADMIAIGRGMLYNPRWVWHAAEVFQKECAYPPQYARSHHSLIGLPIPGNPKPK